MRVDGNGITNVNNNSEELAAQNKKLIGDIHELEARLTAAEESNRKLRDQFVSFGTGNG